MEKSVKLLPKQKESLQQITTQKQQINKVFQELNEKEGLVISFILEMASIEQALVKQVRLDGDMLIVDIAEKEQPKLKVSKKAKGKSVEQPKE